MMLLTGLAIASGGGESWASSGIDMLANARPPGVTPALNAHGGLKQPAFVSAARPPGISVLGRALEYGPSPRGVSPFVPIVTHPHPLHFSHDPTRLRVLTRSRLEFAQAGMIARSGARSAFSTSLPPPLPA